MAPTPHRIAQTSTELKKQYRKNGTLVSERQRKQLARELELNQRAAQAREAEERRKAAAKKRKEKEAKEAAARKQLGVGLATQLIGYSHTQAKLKNGMEAFLGIAKKKEEQKRKKEAQLQHMLEDAISMIENDPSENDRNENTPPKASLGEEWVDEDLDDESLLEVHDMMVLKTTEERIPKAQPQPAPTPHTMPAQPPPSKPSRPGPTRENLEFTRTHGPINKTVEAVLDKLPGTPIELLSQDLSLKTPEWDPAVGLLHKLNPVGLPPHRLRIKIGCVVTLLKDQNTSSRLSRNQHLQILRSENDLLECLVLDGQLRGTKTILTRVPFHAKYRNQHPFERTQFPICVALDFIQPQPLSSQQGRIPHTIPLRKPVPPVPHANAPANVYQEFKRPSLPAPKCSSSVALNTRSSIQTFQTTPSLPIDCWDDFFESSTQISREIHSEANPQTTKADNDRRAPSPYTTYDLPPISTQDLEFSLDDLDDESQYTACGETNPPPAITISNNLSAPIPDKATPRPAQGMPSTNTPTRSSAVANSSRPLASTKKIAGRCRNPGPFATGLDVELSKLRPSQLPKSMFGPPVKRKAIATPSRVHEPPVKRSYMAHSHSSFPLEAAASKPINASFDDFVISTQEAAAFFDDDDNLSFGSPSIAV